jgi:hypothetical protein
VSRSPLLFGEIREPHIHYVDPNADGKLRLAFGTTQGMYLTR